MIVSASSRPHTSPSLATRTATDRPRVLVTVPGAVGPKMNGPVIRAWSMARSLATQFEVTAAVRAPTASWQEHVRLVPFERRRLALETVRHDVLISACIPPYLMRLKDSHPTLYVSDQYDPADLEASHLPDTFVARRRVRSQIAIMDLQLRYADVILHANHRQGERISQRLGQLKAASSPRLLEVPSGLPDEPPPPVNRPLRDRFPQIAAHDTLVLWWGVAWNWLDAETAIRAMTQLAHRPDIKLAFASGPIPRGPVAGHDLHNATGRARHLARALGLLDRTIFFWDDWIAFERRHEFLADADVGLTLHGSTSEAHFAARTRYLDYLWAGLPCILAEGDETGARFADAGFAQLVPTGDETAVQAALQRAADDRSRLDAARRAAKLLEREFRWDSVLEPLVSLVAEPGPASARIKGRVMPRIGAYYARRVADSAVFVLDRSRASR